MGGFDVLNCGKTGLSKLKLIGNNSVFKNSQASPCMNTPGLINLVVARLAADQEGM